MPMLSLRPPSEPPEMWSAFEAVSKDAEHTRRMRSLVLVSRLPWIAAVVLLGAFTAVMAFR